jgi:hypothetical protein
MLIQVVLTSIFLLLLLRVLQQRTLGSAFKVTSVAIIVLASCVVIFPTVTNKVAAFAGVGRGADLIMYICIAVGAYLLTLCFIRLRSMELAMARLIQRLALEMHRAGQRQRQVDARD